MLTIYINISYIPVSVDVENSFPCRILLVLTLMLFLTILILLNSSFDVRILNVLFKICNIVFV